MSSYNYASSKPHAVTSAGGNIYSYDPNGNMISRGTNYTLTYDAENRLNSVTQGDQTTTFTYDGDGQRVMRDTVTDTIAYIGSYYEKQSLPQDLDGDCVITVGDIMQVASRWRCRHGDDCYDAVYDLDDDGDIDIVDIMKVAAVWGETCPVPETVKYYTLGGRRVAMREGDILYYLFTDHLGSTSVVYDTSNNTWTTQRYYPWGTIRPGPNNALPTDYTFTGQRLDETTGLMYYGARYYDPALGQFVQADTIVPNPANPQDLNRYAYVRNNPLRYVDPTGRQVEGYDPGAYLSWKWWEEASLPPTWHELSPEEQLLAYRAYLDFLENPDYYRTLYLDPTSDPALLAPFQVWAEYGENTSLVLLLEVDLWENSVAQIEGAQQLIGEIDDAEYWEMVAGTMLVLGLMEKSEGAVAAYSDAWYKATFPSSEASAQYHYGKHGGLWNSGEEYTEAAKQFYAENINLAQPHPLYTGETGVKIRTDQYFGIYTTDGRIISFGPR